MQKPVIFAIDKNLDFPIEDPVWQKFFLKFNIIPSLYTDMALLTEKMKENRALLSYLPTANFFYFHESHFYTPIANALFASTLSSKINSLLIVAKTSPIHTLAQLKGRSFGYIHPYCTSSYFAMALLLSKHHFSIHNFFSSLKEVGAWQLQIEAVIAGEVDSTMIIESTWHQSTRNAEKTKIIATQENLPSPVMLYGKSIDKTLLFEFQELLFSYKPKAQADAMFHGFIPFQKEQTEKFFLESKQAFANSLVK